ncbi:MAG: 2-C-methyl-D-erythritol 4-phosphate cytidylyltransferase [Muribaculaceae bacterium]|nr:2-C-methyl-D-erythritol 4-phosphate cytidylyltransferase [Muribaculaceae bacterium]
MPELCIIIVAGGTGSRFGSELPKQFCELAGRPVLMHTIDRLRKAAPEAGMVIAMHRDYMDMWHTICREVGFTSPPTVIGGSTRWESVRNALAAVPQSAGMIAVHDAARPLVEKPVMDRLLGAVRSGAHGAIPAVAVTDSLRMVTAHGSESVDRTRYRAVQTPQLFQASLLRRAYELPWRPEFTDDASVMESAGFGELRLVEGSPVNIKITHPADLEIAALLCSISENRK